MIDQARQMENALQAAGGPFHRRAAAVVRGAMSITVLVLIVAGASVVVAPAGEPHGDDSGKRVALGGRTAALPAVDPIDLPTYDIASVLRGWLVAPEGVFLVSPTTLGRDVSIPDVGYLAFWWDYEWDGVFVYGRVLTRELHLGQSVLSLEQDLDVDIIPLILDKTLQDAWLLAGGREPTDIAWREAFANEVIDILVAELGTADMDDVNQLLLVVEAALTALADGSIDPEPSPGVRFPGDRGVFRFPRGEKNVPILFVDCSNQVRGRQCGFAPPCNKAVCSGGSCVIMPEPGPCNDHNPCTINDRCSGGRCVSGGPKSCGDQNACTDDGCNPNIPGGCFHTDACPLESEVCITRGCDADTGCWEREWDCGESDPCNQYGCDPPGGCWAELGCNDMDPCTQDSCTETGCVNTPVDCDDFEICTDDSCDEDGFCQFDPAPGSCEDEVPPNACTNDICENGVCTHPPLDGTPCPDEEPPNECTNDRCQDGTCKHSNKAENTPCTADDTICTRDVCLGGVCSHPPRNENEPCETDNNACTDDICQNGSCSHLFDCSARFGGTCCPAGQTCCNGTQCCDVEKCCGNGQCCAEACEGCIDNGSLSGGAITVNPDPTCIGETITYTISGVTDNGGIERVFCTAKQAIAPGGVTYTWTITKPDGAQETGVGAVATVLADLPGTYSATFTASPTRMKCPPPDIAVGPGTAAAFKIEIATPSGDPATSAGANATNERTYGTGGSPTVTIPCVAAGVPDPSKLRWTIDNVGPIQATWSPSVPGDPLTGTGLTPTATFTGMPPNFNDFGPKTITLAVDGLADCEDTQVVEVFYPGLATNHPGGNSLFPNWFHYYQQDEGSTNYVYGCLQAPTPTSWSNVGIVGSVHICDEAYAGDIYITTNIVDGQLNLTGVSATNLYYANFLGILAHERHHTIIDITTGAPADRDIDFLPNGFETTTSMTDPDNQCSAIGVPPPCETLLDNEVYAGGPVEQAAIEGANTSQDWADPGSNHR